MNYETRRLWRMVDDANGQIHGDHPLSCGSCLFINFLSLGSKSKRDSVVVDGISLGSQAGFESIVRSFCCDHCVESPRQWKQWKTSSYLERLSLSFRIQILAPENVTEPFRRETERNGSDVKFRRLPMCHLLTRRVINSLNEIIITTLSV